MEQQQQQSTPPYPQQQQSTPPYPQQSPGQLEVIDDEDEAAKRLRVMHACLLCKKDHTACEAQRPCSRCIAKGVECIDAEHKKRGRKPKHSVISLGGSPYGDMNSPPELSPPQSLQMQQQQLQNNSRPPVNNSFAPMQKRRKLNEGEGQPVNVMPIAQQPGMGGNRMPLQNNNSPQGSFDVSQNKYQLPPSGWRPPPGPGQQPPNMGRPGPTSAPVLPTLNESISNGGLVNHQFLRSNPGGVPQKPPSQLPMPPQQQQPQPPQTMNRGMPPQKPNQPVPPYQGSFSTMFPSQPPPMRNQPPQQQQPPPSYGYPHGYPGTNNGYGPDAYGRAEDLTDGYPPTTNSGYPTEPPPPQQQPPPPQLGVGGVVGGVAAAAAAAAGAAPGSSSDMNKVCDVLSGLVAQIKELREANKEIRGETQALKRQMLNVALQQQDRQRVAALTGQLSPQQQDLSPQQQQQPTPPQKQSTPQSYGRSLMPSIGDDIGPYGLVGDSSDESRILDQEREAAMLEAQHQQQQSMSGCQYPFLITNAHKPFAMVKRNPKGDSTKADGSFIAANHSFLKLFGYSEAELIGASWRMLLTEESQAKCSAIMTPLLKTKSPTPTQIITITATMRTKQGTIFNAITKHQVFYDGNGDPVMGILCLDKIISSDDSIDYSEINNDATDSAIDGIANSHNNLINSSQQQPPLPQPLPPQHHLGHATTTTTTTTTTQHSQHLPPMGGGRHLPPTTTQHMQQQHVQHIQHVQHQQHTQQHEEDETHLRIFDFEDYNNNSNGNNNERHMGGGYMGGPPPPPMGGGGSGGGRNRVYY